MNMKKTKVNLSVIIVAKNEEKKLPECLESVSEMLADLPAGRQGEIVLIDNDWLLPPEFS